MKAKTAEAMEDWLAGLEAAAAPAQQADGVTVLEIAVQSGWSAKRVRELLARAIACGRWELAGQRATKRIDGRGAMVPVYRRVKRKRS